MMRLMVRDGLKVMVSVTVSPLSGMLKARGQDGRLVLVIEDNGCSLPPGIEGDIVDPFVNLASGGRGMDLELSTVYTVLQQHEGTLRVENGPESGTRFSLGLPVLS